MTGAARGIGLGIAAYASAKAKIPMGRFLASDEIAAMVAWIASPECSFCTGATFHLSGGRGTYRPPTGESA